MLPDKEVRLFVEELKCKAGDVKHHKESPRCAFHPRTSALRQQCRSRGGRMCHLIYELVWKSKTLTRLEVGSGRCMQRAAVFVGVLYVGVVFLHPFSSTGLVLDKRPC